MKKIINCIALFFLAFQVFSMQAIESFFSSDRVRVVATSDLCDILKEKGGFIDIMQAESGIKVDVISEPSVSSIVEKVNNGTLDADVIIGIDNFSIDGIRNKLADTKIFQYAFLTFCFDAKSDINPPSSLKELESIEFYNKIILVDPRRSTLGHNLLEWTMAAFGEDDAFSWWKKVRENAYTVSPSWHAAYSIFLRGEAPLVVSYTTMPVMNYKSGDDHIKSLNFREGTITVDEYIGILKNSGNRVQAKKFFDYVLKNSYKIASRNFMYPVQGEDMLPSEYQNVEKPTKILQNDYPVARDNELLDKWQNSTI